jgi:preprotein translocase subunit SecG
LLLPWVLLLLIMPLLLLPLLVLVVLLLLQHRQAADSRFDAGSTHRCC